MLKNAQKNNFFSKKFAYIKKKLYLCTVIHKGVTKHIKKTLKINNYGTLCLHGRKQNRKK